MMRRSRLLSLVAAAAFPLAACSQGGDDGGRQATAGSASAESTAPVAPTASVDAPGKAVFQQCVACHSILGDGVGPNLKGVYGRKAGSLSDYTRYSPAMKASGITWDDKTLDEFITHPGQKVKGTYMTFPGLADAKKRAELIAYLKGY